MNNNEIQLIIEKRIKKWPKWKINMLGYEKHIHSISSKSDNNSLDEEAEYETSDDIYFGEHNEAQAEQETEEDLCEGDTNPLKEE